MMRMGSVGKDPGPKLQGLISNRKVAAIDNTAAHYAACVSFRVKFSISLLYLSLGSPARRRSSSRSYLAAIDTK